MSSRPGDGRLIPVIGERLICACIQKQLDHGRITVRGGQMEGSFPSQLRPAFKHSRMAATACGEIHSRPMLDKHAHGFMAISENGLVECGFPAQWG